jgi:two-component system nitrate/nitrite response regulator NarL
MNKTEVQSEIQALTPGMPLISPNGAAIRVVIVDSSRISSQSLAAALTRDHLQVVYSGASAHEALNEIAENRADVALISSTIEGVPDRGYELASQIRTRNSKVQIVLLVENSDRESVVRSFRSGARGVFGRDSSIDALSKCVFCVHHGQVWVNSEEMSHLLEALVAPPRMRLVNASGTELLSPREQEVVYWISEGLTNREIADRLGLSENTIKNYIFRIYDKVGISKRVELILYAASQLAPASANTAAEMPSSEKCTDDAALFRWCREAAERIAVIQLYVAECYRDGRGVSSDKVGALMWTFIAEQISNEAVMESKNIREQLERQLPAKEITRAKRRAAEWLNKRKQKAAPNREDELKAAL